MRSPGKRCATGSRAYFDSLVVAQSEHFAQNEIADLGRLLQVLDSRHRFQRHDVGGEGRLRV